MEASIRRQQQGQLVLVVEVVGCIKKKIVSNSVN
jgi:hypothetical protein